jgi:hypothetical protein
MMLGAGGARWILSRPSVFGLGMGLPKAALFVAAMLAGMALYELFTRRCSG